MTHPIYKIDCKEVDDLNQTESIGDYYYNYNGIHFYHKKNNDSKNLIISFNGLIKNKVNELVPLPVFRSFYNKQHNTLSLSDKLLEDYSDKNLLLSWFVSPTNSNYFEKYLVIIKFFINKYDNIIFYGSSGGGFPSLLFASYFNKTALIFNSQLYLEKYWYFKDFINIVNPLLSNENYNIEYITDNFNKPLHSYIYVNENDVNHYEKHFKPFRKFITNKNLLEKYTFVSFIGPEPEPPNIHHNILIPYGVNEKDIINKIFGSL
jgi:hypothetical protein